MNILYIHQHFSTTGGASGTRSYEFAKYLVQSGHSVTMLCGSFGVGHTGVTSPFKYGGFRVGYVDGIRVVEFDISYANHQSFIVRILKFIKFAFYSCMGALLIKSDIIFTTSTPLTVALPGILATKIKRIPFVFEVRDLWPELPKAMSVIKSKALLRVLSWFEGFAYNSAVQCIGLSPGIVDGINMRLKANKPKAVLIPNGCDLEVFCSNHVFDIPNTYDDDFILIFAGAHGAANGLHVIIEAAEILMQRNVSDVKFVLVGDGKEKSALIKKNDELGLDNCVFMNPLSKDQLGAVFRRANAGLMLLKNIPAFYYGTSPNKFFDYIAAKLPVLNNYPGWLASLIQEHHCGLVVRPDDPDSLVESILWMRDQPDELKTMGENSYDLAMNQFSRQELASRFLAQLECYG
ncbi:MAG: glycosyltransferase family 4 protein [Coxiellaceae bacterium]|nr:glycosyltransferase family 4 protein [Coxiellaceae bacterium]